MGRRRFLGTALALSLSTLNACAPPRRPLRVAAQVWIGYQPMYLARTLGYLDERRVRLIETPSASASLRLLATQAVEAAALTLDEFLHARAEGLPLRAILVFDESAGADAVVARPAIDSLQALRGHRIAVEDSAVGALMFSKLLEHAGLEVGEVVKVPLPVDRHVDAYVSGRVEAVVSYEPHITRLLHAGARRLLDSSRLPGLILDVLAVHADAMEGAADALSHLCASYFRALDHLQKAPAQYADHLAQHMGITATDVLHALEGMHLFDLRANHALLSGPNPGLLDSIRLVSDVMLRHRLLRTAPPMQDALTGRFLPPLT